MPHSQYETKSDLRNHIHELALDAFQGHELTKESDNVWRCGRNDTGIYAFRVGVLPGLIVLWGDLGTFTIDAGHGYDLNWVVTSIKSHSYFLSKSSNLKKQTYFAGEFKKYLEDDLVEYATDPAIDSRLSEAEYNDFDEDSFRDYIQETGNGDLADCVYGYGPEAWWFYEAMYKFVELYRKQQ